MSKTIIEVKCVDQVLSFVNTPVIASGGVGEDFVSFDFCDKWDSYAVTVLFWRQGIDPFPVLADSDGLYQVPPELMTSDGVVYFGAVGADPDGNKRTTEAVSYRIHAGAITENTTLPEPDGDVFTQLLAQYADVKLYTAANIQAVAESAAKAAGDANRAVDAAETATGLVYPYIETGETVDGILDISLNRKPENRMLLAFSASADASATKSLRIKYYDKDTSDYVYETYRLYDAFSSYPDDQAFKRYDIVTVMILRSSGTGYAYIQNPSVTRKTRTAIDAVSTYLNNIVCKPASSGLDSSYFESYDGGNWLCVNVMEEPSDGSILRLKAGETSELVKGVLVSSLDGVNYGEYVLVDADGNPASDTVHTFSKGAYLTVMIDNTNKKAYLLNAVVPEKTRPGDMWISGYYNGDDTSDRTISIGDEVCLLIILGQASHSYFEDFMLMVNPAQINSQKTNKGFQMTEMHTSNQDFGGASAELQYNTLTLMGGSDRIGFNKSGCIYYYWGLRMA